jgi:D-glycero-D-manno-heptose 1,7-bisphosphate phosphatase
MSGRTPAIFLDRDGVINYEREDYVRNIDDFVFIEGAIEGIAILSKLNMPIFVITNQSAVGRGLMTESQLEAIHFHMTSEIEKGGGRITATFCCTHRPEDNCSCRKPSVLLFEKAADQFKLDLKASLFIGDKPSDSEAATRIGCSMIRIPTNTQFRLRDVAIEIVRKQQSLKQR